MVFALVLLSKNTTNNTKKPPGLHNKKTKKQNLDNNTKPRPNSGGDSGTLIVAREIVEKIHTPPRPNITTIPARPHSLVGWGRAMGFCFKGQG
tara:strand:- start:342 stop:620 length:279 start_codon:yes stop_codon:yes gene_type:complete